MSRSTHLDYSLSLTGEDVRLHRSTLRTPRMGNSSEYPITLLLYGGQEDRGLYIFINNLPNDQACVTKMKLTTLNYVIAEPINALKRNPFLVDL